MQTKYVPLWAGIFILFLARGLWASGAELRYIRIGEHHHHTRLVFEFNKLPVFEDPVLSDDGKISIAFDNASTVLPRRIPGETTERIEFLEFLKKDQDLTVQVHLSFLYAALNTFPLTDPPRIVVDIRPTDTPRAVGPAPESPATVQPQDAGEPVTAEVGNDGVETATAPPASEPTGGLAVASAGETGVTGQGTEDLLKQPETSIAAPTDHRGPGHAETPDTPGGKTPDNSGEPSPLQLVGEKTGLEVCLLVTLTVLSVAIVGLLAALVYRKGHLPTCPNYVLESDKANGKRIEDIDIKIEKALNRMAPS